MTLKRLVRSSMFNSIATMAVKILSGVFGYWMFILFSKEMSIDEYAQFTIIFSIVMFIGYVSNLGQQTLIVKELPALISNGQYAEQKAIYRFTQTTSFVGAGIGSVLFLAISFIYLDSVDWFITASALVVICGFSLTQSMLGLLRVYGKTVQGIFARDLLWRISTILLFLFAVSLPFDWKPSNLSLSLACMAITLIPIVFYQAWLVLSHRTDLQGDVIARGDSAWRGASLGFAVGVLIANADSYLYTIMVGKLLTSYDTGLFFSSLKTVEIVSVFLVSVALVFAPKFALSIKSGDTKTLQRQCNLALTIQGVPAIACLAIIVTFAPEIVGLFHQEYVSHSDVLMWLAVGMVINALSGPTGILLQLSGLHWKYVKYQSISIGLSLLLMPLVAEHYGVQGVCILFVCSKLLWNMLSRRKIKAALGVEPSVLALFSSRYASFYELKEDILEFR